MLFVAKDSDVSVADWFEEVLSVLRMCARPYSSPCCALKLKLELKGHVLFRPVAQPVPASVGGQPRQPVPAAR